MFTLALEIKRQTGYRLAEVGEALGVLAGLLLLLGGITPFGKRLGTTLAGLALVIGFILLIVATRYGHWGTRHR